MNECPPGSWHLRSLYSPGRRSTDRRCPGAFWVARPLWVPGLLGARPFWGCQAFVVPKPLRDGTVPGRRRSRRHGRWLNLRSPIPPWPSGSRRLQRAMNRGPVAPGAFSRPAGPKMPRPTAHTVGQSGFQISRPDEVLRTNGGQSRVDLLWPSVSRGSGLTGPVPKCPGAKCTETWSGGPLTAARHLDYWAENAKTWGDEIAPSVAWCTDRPINVRPVGHDMEGIEGERWE